MVHAGAGKDMAEAAAPAVLEVLGRGRVLVFAMGSTSSGIPREWGAAGGRPGVSLLEDLSEETAGRVGSRICEAKQPGDVAVASIHWGGNWGYQVPDEEIRFAHRLIEEGVDIVHGHSSHHPKAIEVYRDRLILYGSGDFLDDYEGISGHEAYRHDLRLMCLVRVDAAGAGVPGSCGRVEDVQLVPLEVRRFRLQRASAADVGWLCDLLNTLGAPFGTQVRLQRDNAMILRWR
jgi:poly-gamma-glutamate synthesis protein (capsule biosynthesis protein)